MNELMQKIAEKLSVSVDKIPEVYTGLRNQYVIWTICDSISWIFGIVGLLVTPFIILLIISWFETDWKWRDKSEQLKHKKTLKILTLILIFCISTIVFLKILISVFAPDIVFLKGVLK